jgi:hypothetical protein
MPLKKGYSYNVVKGNVEKLIAEGLPKNQADAAAMAFGRVCFFRRFKHGALDYWLAYPRTHRMKQHYDKRGKPLHAVVKSNPSSRSLAAARRLGEAFTGHPYNRAIKVRQKPATGPRVAIGPVTGIMYLAKRDGRTEQYLHKFAPRSRPLLVTLSDGTRLELLGGAFRFTDRGIVDSRVTVRNRKR